MHPRIVTLEVVLVRLFQVPIELRAIITEDFFPFLPFENDRSYFRKLVAEEEPEPPRTVLRLGKINCIQLNCLQRLYLERYECKGIKYTSFQYVICMNDVRRDRFSEREGNYPNPYNCNADMYCNCTGKCIDRTTFVHPCSERISIFNPVYRKIEGKHSEQSEREIFKWFTQQAISIVIDYNCTNEV